MQLFLAIEQRRSINPLGFNCSSSFEQPLHGEMQVHRPRKQLYNNIPLFKPSQVLYFKSRQAGSPHCYKKRLCLETEQKWKIETNNFFWVGLMRVSNCLWRAETNLCILHILSDFCCIIKDKSNQLIPKSNISPRCEITFASDIKLPFRFWMGPNTRMENSLSISFSWAHYTDL